MSAGKFFKKAGHSVSKGSKSIGHVFSTAGKKYEGAISDVYYDGKTAVGYTGKHLINDVDTVTNAISSPMLWLVVGAVAIAFLTSRR